MMRIFWVLGAVALVFALLKRRQIAAYIEGRRAVAPVERTIAQYPPRVIPDAPVLRYELPALVPVGSRELALGAQQAADDARAHFAELFQ